MKDSLNSKFQREKLRIPYFNEKLKSNFKDQVKIIQIEDEIKEGVKNNGIKNRQIILNRRKINITRNINSFKNFHQLKSSSNTNIHKKAAMNNSPEIQKTLVTKDSSRNNSKSCTLKKFLSRNQKSQKSEDVNCFSFVERIKSQPFPYKANLMNSFVSILKLKEGFNNSFKKIPILFHNNKCSTQSNFHRYNQSIINLTPNKSNNKVYSKAEICLGRHSFLKHDIEVKRISRIFTRKQNIKNN